MVSIASASVCRERRYVASCLLACGIHVSSCMHIARIPAHAKGSETDRRYCSARELDTGTTGIYVPSRTLIRISFDTEQGFKQQCFHGPQGACRKQDKNGLPQALLQMGGQDLVSQPNEFQFRGGCKGTGLSTVQCLLAMKTYYRNSLPSKRPDHLPASRRKIRCRTRPFRTASISPRERALAYKIRRSLLIVICRFYRTDLRYLRRANV